MRISRGLCLAFVTVALIAVIGFALAAQYFQVKIPTIGNIVTVNVAVFNDPACTTQIVMSNLSTATLNAIWKKAHYRSMFMSKPKSPKANTTTTTPS